ncbi:hypothetical protein PFFVO_00002 [Plasmodium falciparum Vietnam Oak-Knoll (FVO)]|uniref:Surface antigen n=1 Tax=Plasmodium falciparum Vietnam Oak-Knoll (FVO) TaxID=1036723 RepID=A0A024VDU5_PLAFA|nr:hypothetical protein PFFVO_00002 [Plasmodium falciparum Vietnam Oak-Knoll (FVO)]
MRVHYINIFFFGLPLNILVYNQRNHKRTTPNHTQTNRSLCECKLYSPANYDSDPQMKKVMENFNKQALQRLRDYDDRMIEKRMQCKDKCDKEIQNIILKDKLERQMAQQLITLETKIDTNDIPTCICEKSLADKMEKECLKCAQNLGGIVTPSTGVLGEIAALAVNAWKNTALKAAIVAAQKAGEAAGLKAGNAHGMNVVIGSLKKYFFIKELGINSLDSYFTKGYYFDIDKLATVILNQRNAMCGLPPKLDHATCNKIATKLGLILRGNGRAPPGKGPIVQGLNGLAEKAKLSADDVTKTISEKVTKAAIETSTGAIDAASTHLYSTIAYSITAILIIVLIMVIIYLILRYRRKKKMKKKLQYIKLLEE